MSDMPPDPHADTTRLPFAEALEHVAAFDTVELVDGVELVCGAIEVDGTWFPVLRFTFTRSDLPDQPTVAAFITAPDALAGFAIDVAAATVSAVNGAAEKNRLTP